MTQSSSQRSGPLIRRERILALAKNLIDDLESVSLAEIDGEFYWRICRSDLLGPLEDLAASIGPNLGGEQRSEQVDEAQQREIVQFQDSALADPRLDDETRQFLIDWYKQRLRNQKLQEVAPDIIDQLPRFVWNRFRNSQRLPWLEPLKIIFPEGGKTIDVRVYSQTVRGAELDALLTFYYRSQPIPVSGSGPRGTEDAPDRVMAEMQRIPGSSVSVHVDFALGKEPPSPASLETPALLTARPYIHVSLSRPLPPEGPIGSLYDAVVRNQQQWHLQLPGGESTQTKEVAIRTWATGLLMYGGEHHVDAQREVCSQTGLGEVSQVSFWKDRNRILARVPAAKPCLYSKGPYRNPSN